MEKKILEQLVNQNLSIRQIGKRIEKSATTVRYWLQKYSLKTKPIRGRHPIPQNGICLWHICTKPMQHQRFCSPQCKNKYYVDRRRKRLKVKAIEYLGGACKICGYNRCNAALVSHHRDPSQKKFNVSRSGHTISWVKLKAELDKCTLLCNRCHAEVHAGIVSILE